MKIGLLNGKLLLRNEKLKLVSEFDTDCCCNPEASCFLVCSNIEFIPKNVSNPGYPYGIKFNHCHRLLVYNSVEICNGTIQSGFTPNYILVTNSSAMGVAGPFYVTFDDPGSGLLNSQPLWWSDCGVGGWALGSVGSFVPNASDIEELACWSNFTGLYRIFILMEYTRAITYDYNANAIVSRDAEIDSGATMLWLLLSYQGITECP